MTLLHISWLEFSPVCVAAREADKEFLAVWTQAYIKRIYLLLCEKASLDVATRNGKWPLLQV